jgi:hypothetical protein
MFNSSSPAGISAFGDGGKDGAGTEGGAAGTSAAGIGSAAGLGVFNVNFFCSPYKETSSSFSFSLFNSPATKFSLLKA